MQKCVLVSIKPLCDQLIFITAVSTLNTWIIAGKKFTMGSSIIFIHRMTESQRSSLQVCPIIVQKTRIMQITKVSRYNECHFTNICNDKKDVHQNVYEINVLND